MAYTNPHACYAHGSQLNSLLTCSSESGRWGRRRGTTDRERSVELEGFKVNAIEENSQLIEKSLDVIFYAISVLNFFSAHW